MKDKKILTLVLIVLFSGCKIHQEPNVDPNYDGIFAHQPPVDITLVRCNI